MKTTLILLSLLTVIGCGAKNEFDVSPAQAMNHKAAGHTSKITIDGGKLDAAHLPPGAVKHEHVYKAGETLPDGSIAKGGEKIVNVKVKKGGENGQPTTDDKDITINK